jgi:hypothetical protein
VNPISPTRARDPILQTAFRVQRRPHRTAEEEHGQRSDHREHHQLGRAIGRESVEQHPGLDHEDHKRDEWHPGSQRSSERSPSGHFLSCSRHHRNTERAHQDAASKHERAQ